ncbi:putative leucine-rich repeat-containing protein DDB_G0290503 [Chironomus tepperi]|uniref:putative leucine-rich repeat-containing protein DDB_G0290503 n=1 Tax=Chironomus tepperi TaxID=113505 RepID=UPI00391F801B
MTMKEMEILLSACIEHYKQVGNEHRKNIQNECEIPLIHEKSKEAAMTMYNEAQKMGSAGEHENYRKVLDRKIEEIYKDLIQQHEKEKRRLKEEKEKLEKEMEEKQRKELERIQKEKEAADKQLEKVKQESKKALELENQKKEKELAELIEQSKQECAEIEKRKNIERQAVDDEIRAIHDKLKEARMQVEQRLREQNNSEQSNQDQNSVLTDADNVMKENEEPASNIISNPTIPQNADIKLESENDNSKENDSQIQIIDAEDNFIKIKESKSDTELDIATNEQGSITQDSQTPFESPNPEQFMNKTRNTFDSSKESSTIDKKQTTSKAIQTNYSYGQASCNQGMISKDSYHGEPSTSKSIEPPIMINDTKVRHEMSKDNLNKEVSLVHVDHIPVESGSTDHNFDTGSSYEEAELATILNSNINHRQYRNLNKTAINKDQCMHFTSDVDGGWKLFQEVPSIINLITYSEFSNSVINYVINTYELTKIFGHETVKNRKVVAVLIAGDDSEDKIRTLNNCLDFLYGYYQSLYKKNQNRPKYVQSSTPTSGSASFEMWNDVFLYTSKDNGDIAIVLMNIRGLFGIVINNLHPRYCLKMFQLASIISSIQVINIPDFKKDKRWTYLNVASILKEYFDSISKGIKGSSKDFRASLKFWKPKNGSEEDIKKLWGNMLLPHINQTVFADFNKAPEQQILPYLHPDKLITKEVNGLKLTGSEFQNMIVKYHDEFQKYSMPLIKDIYSMIMSYQIDIYLQRCVKCYNAFMIDHQSSFKSKECTEDLHKIAMQKAINMFDDYNNELGELKSDRDVVLPKLKAIFNNIFETNQ